MNRVLKRPMFRIGGPTSGGITSGLNRPRMASADMDMKIKELTRAYDNYRNKVAHFLLKIFLNYMQKKILTVVAV